MVAPFPTLATTSSASELVTGLWLPFRALRVIVSTPKVFALSALCGLVTAATLIALIPFWWSHSERWAQTLIGTDSGWQKVASGASTLIIFLLGYAVSALTVPNVVLAPLQDPLSEATDTRCGGFTPDPFSVRQFVRGITESLAHTTLRLGFMMLGFGLLLPLHFIPVAGSALWVGLSTVWSMFWLAVEHLSNPAARRLVPFRQVVRALRQRLFLALGFGAALWVFLWVPVVNFFLLPVAIVAGTLLFRSLEQAGQLTAAPRPLGTNG